MTLKERPAPVAEQTSKREEQKNTGIQANRHLRKMYEYIVQDPQD